MRPSALSTGAIGNNMEIDVDSVNELSISLSFLSQNAFTLVLQNVGAQPIDIVALVIIDSNGHTYVNSTGALMYDGSFNTTLTFDQIIYPQQTLTTEVQYRWTSGLISICFLTSLGNAFSTSTVATS